MKAAAKSIIGKTVTGVIARPAPGGMSSIVMLQFSDGSCFEFVSPSTARRLDRAMDGPRSSQRRESDAALRVDQMDILFPLDGELVAAAA